MMASVWKPDLQRQTRVVIWLFKPAREVMGRVLRWQCALAQQVNHMAAMLLLLPAAQQMEVLAR
jgi:hypothetical protein